MADPFDPTLSDLPASAVPAGPQYASPSAWTNLMNFGAAAAMAGDARTPQGFLQYPDGPAAIGAGLLGAQALSTQQAGARSDLATAAANRALIGANTDLLRAQLPYQRARSAAAAAGPDIFGGGGGGVSGPLGGGGTDASGTSSTPTQGTGGAPQPTDFAKVIGVMEGGKANAINGAGYAGKYQLGTAALADSGNYIPAPGEDVSKNLWLGKIRVAPYNDMTVQQFLANPNAQDAAFQSHLQTVQQKLSANGAAQFIGQTINGVPINQVTLAAGAHYAGATGVLRFLQSGGTYNPTDKYNGGSGIPLSGYMQAAYQQVASGAGRGTQQQGGGQQAPASSIVPPGMPTPQQALAEADQLARQGGYLNMMFPGSGDGLLTQAQQKRDYALKSLGPFEARPESLHWDAVHGWVRNPAIRTVQDPQGNERYASVTPEVNVGGQVVIPGSITPQQIDGAGSQGGGLGGGATVPGGPNGPVAKIGPQTQEILEHQGASYNKARDEINEQANLAQRSNFALDNLRAMSKQVTFDDFAKVRQAILEPLQAAGNVFGIKSDYIDHNLGAYQDAGKISGEIWSTAARQLMGGSREATQTLRMVQNIQPNQTMSEGGLNRVADQMQSLNDLALARQKYAAQYKGPPQDLETNMRQDLDPMAFYVHRMMLTPEGRAIFNNEMVGPLSQTKDGQAALSYISRKLDYARRNGYFDDGAADMSPAAPPSGAPTQAAPAVPQVPAIP